LEIRNGLGQKKEFWDGWAKGVKRGGERWPKFEILEGWAKGIEIGQGWRGKQFWATFLFFFFESWHFFLPGHPAGRTENSIAGIEVLAMRFYGLILEMEPRIRFLKTSEFYAGQQAPYLLSWYARG